MMWKNCRMIWNIFEFAVKNKYISQKSEGIFLEKNSLLHNLCVLCLIHGLLDNIIAIAISLIIWKTVHKQLNIEQSSINSSFFNFSWAFFVILHRCGIFNFVIICRSRVFIRSSNIVNNCSMKEERISIIINIWDCGFINMNYWAIFKNLKSF